MCALAQVDPLGFNLNLKVCPEILSPTEKVGVGGGVGNLCTIYVYKSVHVCMYNICQRSNCQESLLWAPVL